METTTYTRSRTTDFFYKTNFLIFIFGQPNFWIEDLKLSKRFVKFYYYFSIFNDILIWLLIIFEYGSFFTQNNLSEKQKSDLIIFAISHPMLCLFSVMMSRLKKKIRLVIYSLAVGLKREYNDPEVEKQMIASSLTYLSALLISCLSAMVMFVVKACLDIVRHGGTFTTIITAYPDVKDKSVLADVVRVFCYIVWWIMVTRVFAVFILVITLTTCLGYQFKNLQSYFSSLADIFERKYLSQTEKEDKYEAGLKVGIKLHSESLKCANSIQAVCRGVFSGQIIFNVLLLTVLLYQMTNSERTLVNIFATVATASAVLISTGFYMCNAGDVTVEASRLPTAIYFSGWHHCRGPAAVRLRKLVVVAMAHSQQPVVLKGLGYLELSYQSYITLVKTSYSVFSVLY
ncbi:uncharacterized protein LOC124631630 [Helicoverpa zea]|uniref:uncharacterized protein LOC124631630 n=1 Tax=Helicoverpa zea TaxID=7113 RepID=UPI001F5826C0|nr:uncharacterized protein LOC124631630 [Helicoverpa zea]